MGILGSGLGTVGIRAQDLGVDRGSSLDHASLAPTLTHTSPSLLPPLAAFAPHLHLPSLKFSLSHLSNFAFSLH